MSIIELEKLKMKPKKISVSNKRQITIPLEYYKKLNIEDKVECIMQNNCIIIKPVTENSSEEFSEFILQDLIKEGFSGNKLLEEFKKRKKKICPAVEKMLSEADKIAEDTSSYAKLEDIFTED